MIETVEFTCRHCETDNRLPVAMLLNLTKSPTCGKCKAPLLSELNGDLRDLDPKSYQHPLDLEALAKLQLVPGVKSLLRKVIRHTLELNLRLSQQANCVQVTVEQMGEVHGRFVKAAERLGITPLPELYVVQNPHPQAMTYGVDQYFVTVSTGALDLLDEDEQVAVFAHELGHIHSDHMLYKTAARFVTALATRISQASFGLGGLIALPLQLALMWWDRCAELTSDRAALLAVRNPKIVLGMLMKISGGTRELLPHMSLTAFISQADRLDKLGKDSSWARALIFVQEIFRTHPFPVYRAKEIVDWVTTGNFLDILDGDFDKRPPVQTAPCKSCGKAMPEGAFVCTSCGADPGAEKKATGEPDTDEAQADGKPRTETGDFVNEVVDTANKTAKEVASTMRDAIGQASDWWKKNFDGPAKK